MSGPTLETYSTEFAKEKLLSGARSWIGTPFRKGASIKGAGVDCVQLAACIYADSGHRFTWNPPTYTLDGGRHCEVSKVTEWLERSGSFKRTEAAKVGDLLLFKMAGHIEHHVGIKITASTFIHSIKRIGTVESNLGDPTWGGRISLTYRPITIIPV